MRYKWQIKARLFTENQEKREHRAAGQWRGSEARSLAGCRDHRDQAVAEVFSSGNLGRGSRRHINQRLSGALPGVGPCRAFPQEPST